MDDYNPFKRQNVNIKRNIDDKDNYNDNSPLKNELNKIKAERKIKENNYIPREKNRDNSNNNLNKDYKENKYRKKSQEKSLTKNEIKIEKSSSSVNNYNNNIDNFTSNTGNNSSNNNNNIDNSLDPSKFNRVEYKNYLLNKVSKNPLDDKLKIYEKNNNKVISKNSKSRSNSNLSKN